MANSTEAREVVLRLAGITKHFGNLTANDSVDVTLHRGEVIALLGENGAGKTTLMNILFGHYTADEGTVEVFGETLPSGATGAALQAGVGMVHQHFTLAENLTVWENIAFRLINNDGMARRQAKEVAIEKLARVNLPASTADLLPSELSGGMQKRVGIARALAGQPSLMLLDEPTAGLDPITTKAIYRLLDRSIEDSHATVFAITSDMDSARAEYDFLFMLHEGRIVWQGAVADINSSANPYVLQLINGRADGPIKMRLKARV